MNRIEEIDKIVDEIGDADSLYQFAECVYEDRQRIAELKEQLANSIRPKFKFNQTVYRIYQDKIENGMISEIRVDEIGITYHITMYKSKYCETYCYVNENDLFSTKAEAEAKLKELKGE